MNNNIMKKLYLQYLSGVITEAQFYEGELGGAWKNLSMSLDALKKFQGFAQLHGEELSDVLGSSDVNVGKIFEEKSGYGPISFIRHIKIIEDICNRNTNRAGDTLMRDAKVQESLSQLVRDGENRYANIINGLKAAHQYMKDRDMRPEGGDDIHGVLDKIVAYRPV